MSEALRDCPCPGPFKDAAYCPDCPYRDETLHIEGCYLPGDHEGHCRACAACDGDPEAMDMHVCGREAFA